MIIQVQTVKNAKQAAQYGADIIVAQGAEAGGHGATSGTFSIVPAVVDAVNPIPVVAAGGISDGRGLAAAMTLGADGVLLGTRFYACAESIGAPDAKQLIVDSSGDETTRNNIFDYARGLNWLPPFTARTINNKFSKLWTDDNLAAVKMNNHDRKKHQQAMANHDYSTAGVFAGEGIDLIHNIFSSEQIIKQVMDVAMPFILK